MTVRRVRVGDVLELKRDPIAVLAGKAYRRIGIYSWGKGIIHHPPVDGADMGSMRYFTFAPDALILSNIQAWEAAVAVSTAAESGEFVCSNRFLPYLPIRPDEVDVNYVKHYLLSEEGLAALRRASPGTQVRNRTLGKALFEAIEIPLPDLPEQRRIAAHLDRLSALAEAARRSGDAIKQGAAAALEIRISEPQEAPSKPFLELVEIDREWLDLRDGATYSPIGVRGFGRGLIRYPEVPREQLSKLRYFPVVPGRLIISNIKAWEGAVATIEHDDGGRIASNRFLQFRVTSPTVSLEWLRLYLTSRAGVEQLAAASPGAADRNRTLSVSTLRRVAVPVPHDVEQSDILRVAALSQQLGHSVEKRVALSGALVPAARKEVFSAMQ